MKKAAGTACGFFHCDLPGWLMGLELKMHGGEPRVGLRTLTPAPKG